ncbi:PDZ domain-containing protein [Desulfitobacterium sp.]|uniref:S1C family serine protease n=1 Tax=Desulfitobacterium sp. TaxID=49981 RepID=UPI002B1F0E02|nr:PDZ domain-containing protein [Desulfitobacterium sp.]MEA4901651.1 PDZ domain-containing protein [Desulfitobacterium sp.]
MGPIKLSVKFDAYKTKINTHLESPKANDHFKIQFAYIAYAQSHNLPVGAYIAEVSAGGPADKAGIKQGDVITKINDSTVKNSGDLIRELYKYKAGDTVKITLIRDGKTQDVQATLGELQSN